MPQTKYHTIYNWKYRGLIYDDYDALYEIYINTTHCQHCDTEFKDSYDRCMDHDHDTGLFRKIICRVCNNQDGYIKYPDGYDGKLYRQQYYQENKEQLLQKIKQYREDTLEERLKYEQKYRDTHKEQIKQKNKQYRKTNKDKVIAKKKQYYNDNKEEINKKKKQKITCLCGSLIRNDSMKDHLKTQQHLNKMELYMNNLD